MSSIIHHVKCFSQTQRLVVRALLIELAERMLNIFCSVFEARIYYCYKINEKNTITNNNTTYFTCYLDNRIHKR